jgi:hypothetical protein
MRGPLRTKPAVRDADERRPRPEARTLIARIQRASMRFNALQRLSFAPYWSLNA